MVAYRYTRSWPFSTFEATRIPPSLFPPPYFSEVVVASDALWPAMLGMPSPAFQVPVVGLCKMPSASAAARQAPEVGDCRPPVAVAGILAAAASAPVVVTVMSLAAASLVSSFLLPCTLARSRSRFCCLALWAASSATLRMGICFWPAGGGGGLAAAAVLGAALPFSGKGGGAGMAAAGEEDAGFADEASAWTLDGATPGSAFCFSGFGGGSLPLAGMVNSSKYILTCCRTSPYSFHSSISTRSCGRESGGQPRLPGCTSSRRLGDGQSRVDEGEERAFLGASERKGKGVKRTPNTMPICTRAGSLRGRFLASLPARRPQSMRAFSSVARSRALKGTRFARRMVSSREVAVTVCEDPAVRVV